ncbi:hypothetical protein [Bradyrhizobium sp. USDA 4516]
MIVELRERVPEVRLIAAMLFVLQGRGEIGPVAEPERRLDEFLGTCSIRQLKLLRVIAQELTLHREGRIH